MTIQKMNLTIKHRSGRTNTNADALSRNPVDPSQCMRTANMCSVDVEEPSEGSLSIDQNQKMKDIKHDGPVTHSTVHRHHVSQNYEVN